MAQVSNSLYSYLSKVSHADSEDYFLKKKNSFETNLNLCRTRIIPITKRSYT